MGHVQCVTLLLQWNADVGLRDSDGNNCLDLAVDNGNKSVLAASVGGGGLVVIAACVVIRYVACCYMYMYMY